MSSVLDKLLVGMAMENVAEAYILENNLSHVVDEIESNIRYIFGDHCINITKELDTEFLCPKCDYSMKTLRIYIHVDLCAKRASYLLDILDGVELFNVKPSNINTNIVFVDQTGKELVAGG